MDLVQPTGEPIPQPTLIRKIKNKISLQLLSIVGALLVLPLFVFVALQQQEARNFAAEAPPTIASVEIQPAGFKSRIGDRQELSTIAYDKLGNPIFSGVTYEWGMSSTNVIQGTTRSGSSTNTVGTLTKTIGEITEFIAQQAGYGEIHVIARSNTLSFVTKSIPVGVYNKDGTIPTPIISPTPNPDTVSPTVSITNPKTNGVVKRNSSVTITANASDNVGIFRVEFYVDSKLFCSDTTSQYSCIWTVPSIKKNDYVLSVKAIDLAGNSATSTLTVRAN